jgi:type IV secretion system protein VirD4
MKREHSVKKHVRTLQETMLVYIFGILVCIYFGFLCGAAWIPDCNLGDFLQNFQTFIVEERHFLVGVTEATPVFIGIYAVGWSLGFLLYATEIQHPFAGEEYGVAHWGNAKDFTREFANHDPANEVEVNTGDVHLAEPLKVNTANYWIAENTYLSIHNEKTSNLNMLVVGPPGSGKSFRLARPMLSQLCGNFLVTDPKGELYKQTGQYFEDNGYEVMVMNVESEDGMPNSIHFNPFEYIHNESDIMSIAGILMKATTPQDEAGGGNDQFFEQSAEVLLTSLIYLIHYYYPKEKQNWAQFVELLNATTVFTRNDGSIDNRPGGIMDIMRKAQVAWKVDHDSDFPGYVAVEKYYHGAAETTSSIVASLDAHCRYMKLQCVIDLLSEDEIRIKKSFGYSKPCPEASTGKRILFIVTSEDKRYYDWIPSMVYSLFFDELYHLTAIDPDLHESLPQHLTFLMDEFANVTLPDSFVEKLSTMRSRNMSAVIIVQNLIQLKRKFPKFDMDKDLIGNCSIIDILGAPDMDSCEYLSKHFGTMTIHKASDSTAKDYKGNSSRSEDVMQKSLLSAEDIFAMKKDGECAIVVKGTAPLYQTKCRMENTPFVKLLCRKTPYDPTRRESARVKKEDLLKEPSIWTGGEADRAEKELIKAGLSITHLTEDDGACLVEALGIDQVPDRIQAFTPEQKKQLEENRKKYEERIHPKPFDYKVYRKKGEKDPAKFKARCRVARLLLNKGYTRAQVESFYPLIMEDVTAEEIMDLFTEEAGSDEIHAFLETTEQ